MHRFNNIIPQNRAHISGIIMCRASIPPTPGSTTSPTIARTEPTYGIYRTPASSTFCTTSSGNYISGISVNSPPRSTSPAQPQARAPTIRPTHHAHDLDGIHARHIAIQALPPRDPALRRVRQRDEALVHLRRAFLDRVRGVGQPEEVFAVRAAFFEEALDFHQGRG